MCLQYTCNSSDAPELLRSFPDKNWIKKVTVASLSTICYNKSIHICEKGTTMKNKRYFLAGAALLAAAMVLQLLARKVDGFATWYAHGIYAGIQRAVGGIFGLFPFSVVEFGLYGLLILAAVYGIRFWREPLRVLSRTMCLVGGLLFLYTCNCGINYYAMPFSQYAGLQTGAYSREELEALCEYLVEQVNKTATGESYQPGVWRREGVWAMQAAGEQFPSLAGFYPKPKEVTISWILSVQQLCGIYSPFTVEANYNGDMPDYNIPHTICHELSHLKGFMREDEANFIGYLGCIFSKEQTFRYSGYLTGWVYAGNALYKTDQEAYIVLAQQLCDQAQTDLAENNAFWDKYEGKVAEVSNQMNDVYLKVNSQEDGVKSYGRMVDLMLEYYQDESRLWGHQPQNTDSGAGQ